MNFLVVRDDVLIEKNQKTKIKIGLLLNPIAGMGGAVGLKGTDNNAYFEALKMGAKPETPKRAIEFLLQIKNKNKIKFFVAPDIMGANVIKNTDFFYEVIGEIGEITTAEDTKRIAKAMLSERVELLVFCGGDGTAKDIFTAVELKIPVVAIPSGVKMFSSVFALNPRAAAMMVDSFLDGTDTIEKEVLDIDEDSYRRGILKSTLYGYLKVPRVETLIQAGKQGSKMDRTEEENKREIARHIIENMEEDILYLLGPGTTVKAISDELDVDKALLGVDAIYNKTLVEKDINENRILEFLDNYNKAIIIVSPIGGQGFIFGRGNKQFTPEVLKRNGKKNIIIISTEEKMNELSCLRVDTGDRAVDNMLKGFGTVIIGYKEELIIEIKC